jgi:ACS family glucarate transporter-like MFS transporter
MMGNLAGFAAPVAGGVILQRAGGNWNMLIDTMAVAATVSAACWLYLDPDAAQRQRELAFAAAAARLNTDTLAP